jgi:hypothetical protein
MSVAPAGATPGRFRGGDSRMSVAHLAATGRALPQPSPFAPSGYGPLLSPLTQATLTESVSAGLASPFGGPPPPMAVVATPGPRLDGMRVNAKHRLEPRTPAATRATPAAAAASAVAAAVAAAPAGGLGASAWTPSRADLPSPLATPSFAWQPGMAMTGTPGRLGLSALDVSPLVRSPEPPVASLDASWSVRRR